MSRSRAAVAGLTWVAAHRVIGETTRSRAAPSAISAPIQSCSRHAGVAVEIEIGAKADRVDRRLHRRFERRDAGMVDQRDILVGRRIRLAPRIGKGVPWRLDDAQRPIHRVRRENSCRIPRLERHPSGSVSRALQQYPAVFGDRKNAGFASKRVCNSASFSSRISMMKWVFGSHCGCCGSNTVEPSANAKRRSCGRHSPGISATGPSSRRSNPLPGSGRSR